MTCFVFSFEVNRRIGLGEQQINCFDFCMDKYPMGTGYQCSFVEMGNFDLMVEMKSMNLISGCLAH
jgi:hypothetical protein